MLKIESNDRILLIPDQIISVDHDSDGNTRILVKQKIFEFIDSDKSVFNQVADVMRKSKWAVEIEDDTVYDVSFFRSVDLIGNDIEIRFEIGSTTLKFNTHEYALDFINMIQSKF